MLTTVRSGFVTAWRRASAPTRRLPFLAMATTDGVSRYPPRLGMTVGAPPWTIATTEFVVPRSIPMTGSAISHALQQRARLRMVGFGCEHLLQLGAGAGL